MIDHDEMLARLDRLETAVKKIYIHILNKWNFRRTLEFRTIQRSIVISPQGDLIYSRPFYPS
jgi:hypothetical protein